MFDHIKTDRIPHARELLGGVASDMREHGMDEQADLVDAIVSELMCRRTPAKPIARAKTRKIDGELVQRVLQHHKQHPHMSNRERGAIFGIDGGRVSEIIQGLRTPESPDIKK